MTNEMQGGLYRLRGGDTVAPRDFVSMYGWEFAPVGTVVEILLETDCEQLVFVQWPDEPVGDEDWSQDLLLVASRVLEASPAVPHAVAGCFT